MARGLIHSHAAKEHGHVCACGNRLRHDPPTHTPTPRLQRLRKSARVYGSPHPHAEMFPRRSSSTPRFSGRTRRLRIGSDLRSSLGRVVCGPEHAIPSKYTMDVKDCCRPLFPPGLKNTYTALSPDLLHCSQRALFPCTSILLM